MEIQAKIAARIKEIRVSQNLTQEAVAFRSDINRTYMNHIENGRRNISLKILEKIIVHGLDTSIQDFFDNKLFNGKKEHSL